MKFKTTRNMGRFGFLFITVAIAIMAATFSCREAPGNKGGEPPVRDSTTLEVAKPATDTVIEDKRPPLEQLPDTSFIRLADYSDEFRYEIRYATTNNFLEAKVYDCAECYTRVKTARALMDANRDFMEQGYRIKFFDCYRPNDVQYKMWEIVPNPQYVANPVKGSVHNRGGAVDITLVTMDGEELDMGTGFDYFGRRAYHDFLDLPGEVLANRRLLKETMERYGFASIRTEWWHYNFGKASRDKVANFNWPCPTDP